MKHTHPLEQESNIDFYKGLIKKLIQNWYFFAASLIISIGIGHYIYKSSEQRYENNLVILIQESNDRRAQNANDLYQLEMFNLPSDIEDELGIISSFPVVFETVKNLNLDVSYYISRGLIKPEIYNQSPIQVVFDQEINQATDVLFELSNITKDGCTLKAKKEEGANLYNYLKNSVTGYLSQINLSQKYKYGDDVQLGPCNFKIILNTYFNPEYLKDKKLYFKFNNIKQLAYIFQGDLTVERASAQTSLVILSVKSSNSVLSTDFLNTLSKVYLNRNLEKKNKIADKTIDFIDRQISGIADSLGLTANQLKDFRVKNNVMDISYLSQNVYEQMRELENQRAELVVASKYYDYIKEYFENNTDLTDLLAPSAMGVEDPQLQALITQLTNLNADRSLYLDGKSTKNPNLPLLNSKINNIKKTILENIDYIVYTSNITINDINNRIALLKQQVENLPTIEKELTNIEREFHVNDAIYTFLLSTRAEAEIARASNQPDYEIIDPAKYSSSRMVSPKKNMIYFSSFFIGVMLPIALVMALGFFKNSLDDKKDIDKISHFTLIGTIARNEKRAILPLIDYPKSLIAESFRSARTSMQFFQKGKPKQKILITSSMSGDGKTFIAMNLASAYSHYGKKTLLLEFDLRNPKLTEYLGLQKEKGLSSYLINDARLEDIIQKTEVKNLEVIPAGEIPPNPVELIASENTLNLMEILQSIYDYIIIDTPPIGVVTDSYLLMDHSDANLFVVRLNYTNKRFFTSLIRDLEQKEIPNIGILINDDSEKTSSVYYSDATKLTYFQEKVKTLKSLLKIRKEKSA